VQIRGVPNAVFGEASAGQHVSHCSPKADGKAQKADEPIARRPAEKKYAVRNAKAKGSDGRFPSVGTLFLFFKFGGFCMKKEPTPAKKPVVAIRKTCTAQGTGLSHYVLMKDTAKK
jgi:modified peptide precursor CbpA